MFYRSSLRRFCLAGTIALGSALGLSFLAASPNFAADSLHASDTPEMSLVSIADAPQGIYEIASAADPDFVLDIKHCTVQDSDSRSLQMYHSLDVNQQKFYLEDLPGVACRFTALHSGDALTVSGEGSSVAMAALEHSESQNYAKSQCWQLKSAGDGTYFIQSRQGKYLTLGSADPFLGSEVVLSDYTGASSQQWILNETWISSADVADTDLINPYAEDGEFESLRLALKFGSEYEILRSSDLAQRMTETEDHKLILDPDYLSSFVEQLAQKYDTQGNPRRFRTSYGNEITLYKGNFGWKLDASATLQLLQDSLTLTTPKTLSPLWSHKGNELGEGSDIEDSYVEVDLENQKVWLYKNGKKLLETDCVSGTYNTDRQTPGGVYSIYYKQSPAVLNGPGYSSPVDFWMPFNGGIGLHDAQWRSSFGGDIYLTNGSHGCINLPRDAAELIYNTVTIGYPVVCYQ